LPVVSYLTRARRYVGSPAKWELVHTLLTQLQKNVFQEQEETDPQYNHRVTLFLKRRWVWALCRWPWSGYLVIAERSGQSTIKSQTRFLCATEKDPGKHEGVAGQTWVAEHILVVADLPDLQGEEMDEAVLQDLVREYARKTWVSPEWVLDRLAQARERHRTLARSYVGIPVEINGRVVGVVVLDSRNPRPPRMQRYSSAYDLVANSLSNILKKGVNLDQ